MKLGPERIDAILREEARHDCLGYGEHRICVKIVAIADLPTRFGQFQIAAFLNNRDGKEHVAIMHGDVFGRANVLTRLHSACLTGDALGSLRCDCRDQLEESLRIIGREPCGLVLYLQQEGRGIGLINKIRAYQLQDRGLDTVEANVALGFRDDEREYAIAAHMLDSLKVRSIRLLTNNPRKVEDLTRYGITIAARIPHMIPPNQYNRFYLETKAIKEGHFLDFDGKLHLEEQGEPVEVEVDRRR
ncbi:MAG TPA: GTP cyclohydrolase II [Terriglobales bacterium]|nr:GTP cyclohydrolase II [Terriglobales bacterium]